jgi:hypothetical protein
VFAARAVPLAGRQVGHNVRLVRAVPIVVLPVAEFRTATSMWDCTALEFLLARHCTQLRGRRVVSDATRAGVSETTAHNG